MNNVTEFLPFLVPLVISELALLAYTLYHILTHKSYKRGNRTLWLIVVIVGMLFLAWEGGFLTWICFVSQT